MSLATDTAGMSPITLAATRVYTIMHRNIADAAYTQQRTASKDGQVAAATDTKRYFAN